MNWMKKLLCGLLVLCVLASSFAVFADEPEFPNDLAKKIYYGADSFTGEEDLTGSVEVTCDIEIDLAGHTLSGDSGKSALRIAEGKNVTVKNAEILAKGGIGVAAIEVGKGATLTLESVAVVGSLSLTNLLGSGILAQEGAKIVLNNCFVFGDVALDNKEGAEIAADDTYLLGVMKAMTDDSVLTCSEGFAITDTAQWLADNYPEAAADSKLLALVVTELGLGKGIVSAEVIGEVKAEIAEDESKVTVTAKEYESKHHDVFSYKWVPQYAVLNEVEYPMEDGKVEIGVDEADFTEGAEGYVHYVLSVTISEKQKELLDSYQEFIATVFPKLNELDLRGTLVRLIASFAQDYLDVFGAPMDDAHQLIVEAYEDMVSGNKLEEEALRQKNARADELQQLIDEKASEEAIAEAQKKADDAALTYEEVKEDVKNVGDKLDKMAEELRTVTDLFDGPVDKLFNAFKNTHDLTLWLAENIDDCYEIAKQVRDIVVDASKGMDQFEKVDGPALDANYEILNQRSLEYDGKEFEYDSSSSYKKVDRAQEGLQDPMDLLLDIMRYANVIIDNEGFWRLCDMIREYDPEPKVEAHLRKFLEEAPDKLAAMIADAGSYEEIYEANKKLVQEFLDAFLTALPDLKEDFAFIAEKYFTDEVYNAYYYLVKALAGDKLKIYPALCAYLPVVTYDAWSSVTGNIPDDYDAFVASFGDREELFFSALDELVEREVVKSLEKFVKSHFKAAVNVYGEEINLAFTVLKELNALYPVLRPIIKDTVDTLYGFYPAFDEEADALRAVMLEMLQNDPDKFWASLDQLQLEYINPYLHNEWVDVWEKNVPISVDPILPPPPPPTGDTVVTVSVAAVAAAALLALGISFGKKRK